MSGESELTCGEVVKRPVLQKSNDLAIGDIVCDRASDGRIDIGRPLYFSAESLTYPNSEPAVSRHNVLAAANILFAFIHAVDTTSEVSEHLRKLNALWFGDDQLLVTKRVRKYFMTLSRRFCSEFLDTMPDPGGIIPVDQIGAWLDRIVEVRHDQSSLESLEELADDYSLGPWPEVTKLPFVNHGFVCTRSTAQDPQYNIRQRIWLKRRIRMDWLGEDLACRSLAANVIDRFIDMQAAEAPLVKKINGDVADFYAPFADDFVDTMPERGGQIPVSVINRWFVRHL